MLGASPWFNTNQHRPFRDTLAVLLAANEAVSQGIVPLRSDGYIPPCIPTRAHKPPAGPDWVHGSSTTVTGCKCVGSPAVVRLFTRRGFDWSARYPAIAITAAKLGARSFTLDGEAVVCGPDGVAIFDALHRHGTASEAMLYAFDLLELDGVDYRPMPLRKRKDQLARLPGRRNVGIVLNDHTDARGALVFEQACRMGLEGIVSKTAHRALPIGPSRDWIKVKNPDSPAMIRAREADWS